MLLRNILIVVNINFVFVVRNMILWKYGESMKEWWLIKSGDRLDDCKA